MQQIDHLFGDLARMIHQLQRGAGRVDDQRALRRCIKETHHHVYAMHKHGGVSPLIAEANLRRIFKTLLVVPFDEAIAEAYSAVRAGLEKRGAPIGPLDTLIAAHALSLGWTLVTYNTREFKRIPTLKVEDWLA